MSIQFSLIRKCLVLMVMGAACILLWPAKTAYAAPTCIEVQCYYQYLMNQCPLGPFPVSTVCGQLYSADACRACAASYLAHWGGTCRTDCDPLEGDVCQCD